MKSSYYLYFIQAELLIGDQDGTIYRWDMTGDKNEKYVGYFQKNILSSESSRQSMLIIQVQYDRFQSIVMPR